MSSTSDFLVKFLRNLEVMSFAYLYAMPNPVAHDILGKSLRPVRFGVFPQGVAPLLPRYQFHAFAQGVEGSSEVIPPDGGLTNPINSLLSGIVGSKQDFIEARLDRHDSFLASLGC